MSTNQKSFGAAISPNVSRVALWNDGAATSTVRVVSPTTLRVTFTLPATTVTGVDFSDDGRLLVVTDAKGDISITTLSDGHTVVGTTGRCPAGGRSAHWRQSRDQPRRPPGGRVLVLRSGHRGQDVFGPARRAVRGIRSGVRCRVQPCGHPVGHRIVGQHGHGVEPGVRQSDVRTRRAQSRRQWCGLQSERSLCRDHQRRRHVAGVGHVHGQALQIDHDQSGVSNPAFSPDSRMVAESNDDNQIRVWTVCADCQDPSALLRASASSVVTPLTPLERAEAATQDG